MISLVFLTFLGCDALIGDDKIAIFYPTMRVTLAMVDMAYENAFGIFHFVVAFYGLILRYSRTRSQEPRASMSWSSTLDMGITLGSTLVFIVCCIVCSDYVL